MKYENWSVTGYDEKKYRVMLENGISPLVAGVLCSHGFDTPEKSRDFLSDELRLNDPYLLPDMDKAVSRVEEAIASGEHIAVYGDYDVDGITSTCLLTDYIKSRGGNCTHYIPGRIEEGYGLNTLAIDCLKAQGVTLIITVDCGITAVEEAEYANSLGIQLVITDHHECKDTLPPAVAVVDPHRPDSLYPFPTLAGVGVAFKLVCALEKSLSLSELVDKYGDLVCLGTVADVMPLLDENRILVKRGLASMQHTDRPGIRMLLKEANAQDKPLNVSAVGFTLAPRINAAGRMGRIDLATGLFFSKTDREAQKYAAALCDLNRERQDVEASIFKNAVQMVSQAPNPSAIVLADEGWHQGVVGIVASRLAEEYRCPTFLICLDGDKGKASSRSYGGFNLFEALEASSHLLCNYGGHELAAGFTIQRQNIDAFREHISSLAAKYYDSTDFVPALTIDFEVRNPGLLTMANIADLDRLEPCGTGSPKPLLYMEELTVTALAEVGGGKHMKLKLDKNGHTFNAICFSSNPEKAGITEGDLVDIAFCPQINEYRGSSSIQLVLTDIRCCRDVREDFKLQKQLFNHFVDGSLTVWEATELLPERSDFASLWRYLKSHCTHGRLYEDWGCLGRKVSRYCGRTIGAAKLRFCLAVFADRGLVKLESKRDIIRITIIDPVRKIDLTQSPHLQWVRARASGD